jgi:hypothetical protein
MSIFKNTFKPEIRKSIGARQTANEKRTPQAIQYLNSRNAWIRMTSSVNVSDDKGDLASKYILQGGTLYQKDLRSGVGDNGAYSLKTPNGQPNDRGIRPMPGINSIDVKSKSAYGSLREVVVNFQVWDIKQLEDLELLYMRPGYTVLIEWGWLPYLESESKIQYNISPYEKMFTEGTTKEIIWKDIFQKSLDNGGNYDAMFGYVKNYSWAARPDGGYDCSTTIISIGEILESLKVNFSPQNLKLVEGGSGLIFTNITEQTIKRYKKNILAGLFSEIYEKVNANNEGSKEGVAFDLEGSNYFILTKELKNVTESEGDDDKLVNENANSKQIYIRLGSLIDILNKKVLLQDKKSKLPVIQFSLKEREFDLTDSTKNPTHELLCLAHPLQLSVDPTICYIKNSTWGNITPQTDDQIDATSGKDISKFSNKDYSKDLTDIKAAADSNDASSDNENKILSIVKPIAKLGINELSELNSQCLQKYNRTIYSLMDSALSGGEIDQILTEGGISEDSSVYKERLKAIQTNFVEELKKKKEETKELAEDAASNSKYLDSNAQNFFLDNKPSLELGIIANIYVNLQFLYSLSLDGALESQDKKEKQEIAIYDFFKNIMSQISDSIGNVNNFDIHVDPTDNIARIIDINYVDEISRADAYKNAFVLEVQGLNSVVRSYKLESQIFPEQSTMISIGAQAKGGALGVNSNTLIDFNKNLVDRILPEKVDANVTIEDQASAISEQISALEENLKTIYNFLGDTSSYQILFTVPSFDVNSASTYKGALRDIIAYFQSFTNSNSKNRAIIPTKLSVDMDGIGGLVIGHLFRIPENLLPRGYKGLGTGSKLGYIITGISHNLNGKDWTTGIEAQTIILDEPSGEDVGFKDILKDATTALVSGNVGAAVTELTTAVSISNANYKLNPPLGNKLSSGPNAIVTAAKSSLQFSTKATFPKQTNNGKVGCAAAVSVIFLRATGRKITSPNSIIYNTPNQFYKDIEASTFTLYDVFSKDTKNWKKRSDLNTAKPGDIVVTSSGGKGAGHVGIVSDTKSNDGKTYDIISNSSGGFTGKVKDPAKAGSVQNNYSIAKWSSITSRNPSKTAAFEYIGPFKV